MYINFLIGKVHRHRCGSQTHGFQEMQWLETYGGRVPKKKYTRSQCGHYYKLKLKMAY